MATSFNSRLSTAPEEGCKAPCVTVSLTSITLSGEQTIGVTAVVSGDRVLVAGQTDTTENGIYNCDSGAWTRAKDWNTAEDVIGGMLIPVSATEELYQLKPFTGAYNPGVTAITFGVGILSARSVETQTGSQAVARLFTLVSVSYTPGANNLEVDQNGQRLNIGIDYTEPSSGTVLIDASRTINDDDIFTFRTNTTVSNSVTTTSAITHIENSTTYNLATYLQNLEVATVADLILLSPVSGQVCKTVSYYAGTIPSGGGEYKAETLTNIRTARGQNGWVPDGTIDVYAINGLVWLRMHDYILHVPNTSGDFGALLSAVFDYVRATPNNRYAFEIIIPGSQNIATTSINAAGLAGRIVRLRSSAPTNLDFGNIISTQTGIALDCSRSPSIILEDFGLQCSDSGTASTPTAGTVPSVGIFFARENPGASNDAGYHKMRNVTVTGHCYVATIDNYAAEVSDYDNVQLTNYYAGADTLLITNDNQEGVVSDNVNIATGGQSNTTFSWRGGQIWSKGGSQAKCVRLRNVFNARFRDLFTSNVDGHSTFYITGGGNITIDGVREENEGATHGPGRSIYVQGDPSGLTINDYASAALETSGYFIEGEGANSTIQDLSISGTQYAYVNKGIYAEALLNPNINFLGQVELTSHVRHGSIASTVTTIPYVNRCRVSESTNGKSTNFYRGVTASVNNAATINITPFEPVTGSLNYAGNTLYSYIVQSNGNSGDMSCGFIRTNNAGGASNTLTVFGKSENNVSVTGGTNYIVVTNNTGGTETFTVNISSLA
jgi:hypothetical protein